MLSYFFSAGAMLLVLAAPLSARQADQAANAEKGTIRSTAKTREKEGHEESARYQIHSAK
jgi:hypothetical protein